MLAWVLDFTVVLAVAVLFGSFTFHRISGHVTELGVAGESVWRILGSGGNIPGMAAGVASSIWDTAVLYVMEAFAALVLFAFAYQFVALAWTRGTLGKALTGLRVVPNGPEMSGSLGRRRAAVRAMVTAVTDVACYAAACCLLLSGEFLLSMLCWVTAVIIFWVNALPTLFGAGRSLADRLAGTSVTEAQLFRAVAYAATERGQAVWQGGRQVAQQVVDHERFHQIRASGADQARRIADLGRAAARGAGIASEGPRQEAHEGAQRETDPLRRISESHLGRATTGIGRSALTRARSAARLRRPKPVQPPLPPSPHPHPHPPGSFGPPPASPPADSPPGRY